MRVLLVVNPTASSVTPRVSADVERVLRAAHDVEVAQTTRRGHAATLAREAIGNFDVVAVLAGDGTLNEAADGLAGADVTLAALPGGSTRRVCSSTCVSLPISPRRNARFAVRKIGAYFQL